MNEKSLLLKGGGDFFCDELNFHASEDMPAIHKTWFHA